MNDELLDIGLKIDVEESDLKVLQKDLERISEELSKSEQAYKNMGKSLDKQAVKDLEKMRSLVDSVSRESKNMIPSDLDDRIAMANDRLDYYKRNIQSSTEAMGKANQKIATFTAAMKRLGKDNKEIKSESEKLAEARKRESEALFEENRISSEIRRNEEELRKVEAAINAELKNRASTKNYRKSDTQKELELEKQILQSNIKIAKNELASAEEKVSAATREREAISGTIDKLREERKARAEVHAETVSANKAIYESQQGHYNKATEMVDVLKNEINLLQQAKSLGKGSDAYEEASKQAANYNSQAESSIRKMAAEFQDLVISSGKELGYQIRTREEAERMAYIQETQKQLQTELAEGFMGIYNASKQANEKSWENLKFSEKQKIMLEEENALRHNAVNAQREIAQLDAEIAQTKANEKYSTNESLQIYVQQCEELKEKLKLEYDYNNARRKSIEYERKNLEEQEKSLHPQKEQNNNAYFLLRAVKMLNFEITKLTSGMGKLASIMSRFIQGSANALIGLLFPLKMLPSYIKKSTSESRKLNKSFNMGFIQILKYSLGIRSLYTLIGKLRSFTVQGFKNMAIAVSDVDKQISSLWNNMRQMRNMVAAMIQPLLNIAVPAFDKLTAYVERATIAIGSFFAALTGQTYVYKASKVTGSWADSLDKSAKNAKKLKKELSGLDKLNVLNSKDKDNGSGGSGGSGEGGFTPIPIDPKILDMANRLKDLFKDLFAPLKAAWDKYGKYVMDSFKYMLDQIKKLLSDILRDFMKVWKEAATQKIFENVLQTLGNIFRIIGNIAKGWRKAWNANDNGLRILRAIRDIILIISEDMVRLTNFLVKWTETLNWVPLFTAIADVLEKQVVPAVRNISGLITDILIDVIKILGTYVIQEGLPMIVHIIGNIIEAIGNMAGKFREAWNDAKLGRQILTNIKDIIDIILKAILAASEATAKWAKTLNFAPLLEAINRFLEAMKEPIKTISDLVVYLWEHVVLTFMKYLLEVGFPNLLDVLGKIAEKIDWAKLKANLEIFMDAFEKFLELGWETFLVILEDVGNKIADIVNSEGFQKLIESFRKWVKDADPEKLAKKIEELVKTLIALKAALVVGSMLMNVAEGLLTITNLFKNLKSLDMATPFKGLKTAISDAIPASGQLSTAIEGLKSEIELFASTTGKTMGGVTTMIAGYAMNIIGFGDAMDKGFTVGNTAAMVLGATLTGIGAVILGAPALIAAAVAAGIIAVESFFVAITKYPKEFGEAINKVGENFGNLGKGLDKVKDKLIEKFNKIGEDIGKALGKGFKEFPKNFETWVKTVDWLKLGENLVKGVLTIFYLPQKLASMILEAIVKFVASFIKGFQEGFDMHSPSKKMVPLGENIVKGVLQGITNIIANIGTWLLNNLAKPFINGVKTAFNTGKELVESGKKVVTNIKNGVTERWGTAKQEVGKVWTAFKTSAKNGLEKGKHFINNGKSVINGVWSGFKERWTTRFNNIKETWTKLKDNTQKALESSKFQKPGKSVITGIWNGLKEKYNAVAPQIKNKWQSIKDAAAKKLNENTLASAGRHLISGLWNGIKQKWQEVKERINEIWRSIKDKAKDIMKIKSPSKVFIEIGKYIMEGLGVGIEDEASEVEGTLEDAMKSVLPSDNTIHTFYDEFINMLQELSQDAVPIVTDMITKINDCIANLEAGKEVTALLNSFADLSNIRIPDITLGTVTPASATVITIDDNDKFMNKLPKMLKDAFVEALQETALTTDSNDDIVVEIDGTKVFTAIRKENDVYKKRYGKSAFA